MDQYQQPLLVFFNNCTKNPSDAEDLTQEVFYKILRRNNYQNRLYERRMVFAIAWNVLRDRQRRDKSSKRDKHIPIDDEFEKADPITLEQMLSSCESYHHFLSTLDKLSPVVRTAFILNRFEGFSHKHIAKYCGVTVSAVEKRLKTAMTQMKKIKDKRQITIE